MKKQKTRAIFGGSFDPPTNAHYMLSMELSKRFDEVIVVPAFISPFKLSGAELDGEQRLMLLRQLFDGIANITVSDIELSKKGTSYSYMTARHFYKKEDKLYFVIGSDGVSTLDKWARTDLLKQTVTFYIVERPYFPIKQSEIDYAENFANIEIAPFVGQEGSSSLFRAAVAFNKENEVSPQIICDYVNERNLYSEYKRITAKLKDYSLKDSRIEHVYRTTKMAILLAKNYGEDTDKAIRAALLHDIGKYLSINDADKLNLNSNAEYLALPKSCRHQISGAIIAGEYFAERDENVIKAIKTHTTGDENMSLLQKIIFTADYIEEGRAFEGLDKIRQTAFVDLDRAVFMIFENTINYLKENNMEVALATENAYNKLKIQQE